MRFLKNLRLIRDHRFLRWILIVATASIILAPLFAHIVIYPLFENLLIQNSEREAVRAARFMAHHMALPTQGFSADSLPAHLDDNAAEVIAQLELLKFKVFAPDGDTLYSTDAEDIGKLNTNDYFVEHVARGQPYSKVVKKRRPTLEGQAYAVDVVETYVPVMADDGAFAGAFEIYYDITERLSKMNRLANYITLTSVFGALLLLVIVLFLLSRVGSSLEQQDRLQDRLRELNRQHQMILDTAGEGIFGVDSGGHLTFANPAALKMMGWPLAALKQDCHHRLVHHTRADGSPNPPDECPIRKTLESGELVRSDEELFWRKDGSSFPVDMSTAPLMDDATVTGAVVVFHDISERLKAERELKTALALLTEQARFDGLTNVANRRTFDEILTLSWRAHSRSGEPLSLLMVDVDFFKHYNDRYGHLQGDECLKQIASALACQLYRSNDHIARYGGEEFVFILGETGPDGAALVAERALRAVRALRMSHNASDAADHVTVSVGVATRTPVDAMHPNELIKLADDALYEAKTSGRNRYAVAV